MEKNKKTDVDLKEFYKDGIKEFSENIENTEYLESIYYFARSMWLRDAEERN